MTRTETTSRPLPGAPKLEHRIGCPHEGVQPALPAMPAGIEVFRTTPPRLNDRDPQEPDVTVSRCMVCGAANYSNGAKA